MATVLCALLLLAYEATRVWMLRQVALWALQESGRIGTTQQLQPTAMQQGFDAAMAAWWPSPQHQARYYQHFMSRYGFAIWRIWQLSPSDQDFTLHVDRHLTLHGSVPYPHINNYHQLAQYYDAPSHATAQSIFSANTLHTQLIFWYEPSLALSRSLMRLLWPTDPDPYLQQGKAQGLLPVRIRFSLPMQSHPIQWPLTTDSAIQRVAAYDQAATAWHHISAKGFMGVGISHVPSSTSPAPPTHEPPSSYQPPTTQPPAHDSGAGDLLINNGNCEGASCCY